MPAVVVVRFRSGIGLPYAEGPEQRLGDVIGERWKTFLTAHPGARFAKVFDDPGEPVPDEEAYYEVRLPDGQRAKEFARDLNRDLSDIVEEAFVRARVVAPRDDTAVPDGTPTHQGYFRPAPHGINALAAWRAFQVAGSGVSLADIESGWELDHPDLPDGLAVMCGENSSDLDHGTAVLGILIAKHGGGQVLGGVPHASVLPASYVRSIESTQSVAWAMDQARQRLAPGDVILLEAMCDYSDVNPLYPNAPAEVQSDIRRAIDRCTRKGILVVAPAGNSGVSLDGLELDANPSGALIVGASNVDLQTGEHRCEGLNASSNFGRRVDCFAWGHDIYTLDTDKEGRPRYQKFRQTSGAAAIIATAAVLLQSLARKHLAAGTPGYLDPAQLRDYLRNPDNGTGTADATERPIGVMPDMNKVMDQFNADHLGGRAHPVTVQPTPMVVLAHKKPKRATAAKTVGRTKKTVLSKKASVSSAGKGKRMAKGQVRVARKTVGVKVASLSAAHPRQRVTRATKIKARVASKASRKK